MWEDYAAQYRLRARVLSISQVIRELPDMRRYRLVLIDESHNLRNREGKRYKVIQDYIEKNESKVILLSATPYNKEFTDLSNQLRLFIPEDNNLGIRPERLLREIGETAFIRQYQSPVHSLRAFEKSPYADDWRDLMRQYMVRRTRSFIQDNYAKTDKANGRKYLLFQDGTKSYFPTRVPKTQKYPVGDGYDQYGKLYAWKVVDAFEEEEEKEEAQQKEDLWADQPLYTEEQFRQRAVASHAEYTRQYKRRFKWLKSSLFKQELAQDLLADARALSNILEQSGGWGAEEDEKMNTLVEILSEQHPQGKVLIFTQNAGTGRYLGQRFVEAGINKIKGRHRP